MYREWDGLGSRTPELQLAKSGFRNAVMAHLVCGEGDRIKRTTREINPVTRADWRCGKQRSCGLLYRKALQFVTDVSDEPEDMNSLKFRTLASLYKPTHEVRLLGYYATNTVDVIKLQ